MVNSSTLMKNRRCKRDASSLPSFLNNNNTDDEQHHHSLLPTTTTTTTTSSSSQNCNDKTRRRGGRGGRHRVRTVITISPSNAGKIGCYDVGFVIMATIVTSGFRSFVATTPSYITTSTSPMATATTTTCCFSSASPERQQEEGGKKNGSNNNNNNQASLLKPLQYRHDGQNRYAPLPRKTRWIPDPPSMTFQQTENLSVVDDDNNNNNDHSMTRTKTTSKELWSWPPMPKVDNSKKNDPTSEIDVDLWYIRGVPYDLNDFLYNHPGGYRYLINVVNQDITELFESHHIGVTAPNTLTKFQYNGTAADTDTA